MNVFTFDIETIPDVASARRLYNFQGLSDAEVAQALYKMRREETHGSEFLRVHLHQIVAISVVMYSPSTLKVWSLGDLDADEPELIRRFHKGLEEYSPVLVSWNGGGFDLPVLNYRALLHGISSPRYWETGNQDQAFRWNNYLNRYHDRHLDLMDVLSLFQARATAPLNEIAIMLGFPGKMGMHGSEVWSAYQRNELKAIRDYCETDVLNTFLIYLRFQLIRGHLLPEHYAKECQRVRDTLSRSNQAHLLEFLKQWVE